MPKKKTPSEDSDKISSELAEIQEKLGSLEEHLRNVEDKSRLGLDDQLFFGLVFSLFLLFVTFPSMQDLINFCMNFELLASASDRIAYTVKSVLIIMLFVSSIYRYHGAIMKQRDLIAHRDYQVFLNFPYDDSYLPLATAMQFGVVAAGLIPVCAKDLTTQAQPRLGMLVSAIACCQYSVHDLSRSKGEGTMNFSRMNMPIESGMALFHALNSQRRDHTCTFFVQNNFEYKAYASDLAGLDLYCHENNC